MSDSIRVVCRLRPLNKIQIEHQGEECVTYGDKDITLAVGGEETKYSFAFDKIFGPNTHQASVYQEVSIPIIRSVISGFNGTVFAYGQTGGGKTWTMEGPNHHDPQYKGLIPRTIEGLFESIAESDQNLEFVIKSSYVEIYNEKLFDLLDPSKARLEIKEDRNKGVFIQNCTEISVSSCEQMLKTMDTGSKNRKVAFTGMNERSSRSHSLFIIHLYQRNTKKDSSKQSKLYFVDLAGSEKVGKTGVQGQQLEEAKNINKSLSALGNVINALTSEKKEHVPYRDSKLTRILQESLGGNSRTTLIINCSMCTYNDKETLSTLRFGYRAKSIKNKPKVNEERSVKELMGLLEAANKTIAELKIQLKLPVSGETMVLEEGSDERDAVVRELKEELEEQKREQVERNKEMESRIKQLLLELEKEREDKSAKELKWSGVFSKLHEYLNQINKYINRSYVDLEYCLNNILLNDAVDKRTSQETVENTLRRLEEFDLFYRGEAQAVIEELVSVERKEEEEEFKAYLLTPEKRKSRTALSQPVLYSSEREVGNEDPSQNLNNIENASCVNQGQFEDGSDKVSQSSLSQFETILESLETKESHRMVMEEMAANMRELRRENEELGKKIGSMLEEREKFQMGLEEKFEEKIMELQERVHEYKNIMKQKDVQLTGNFEQIDRLKKEVTQEKVISDRFKKIIEANGNMKAFHEMEERVRSLANERQKIFNELYSIREQLDECEITIKEKDEHIESLKTVMMELNEHTSSTVCSSEQINRNYNTQVYGTESPNIVQTVKGGGKKEAKKSSVRKKTEGLGVPASEKQEEKKYVPFFKSFFN